MTNTTKLKLSEYVATKRRCLKILPLLHCCDGAAAVKIVIEQEMKAKQCDVYGEHISYFFYGRSSYVPNEGVPPSKIWEYFPVVFIYRPDANYNIRRVLPIDSGAFDRGLFSSYFHKSVCKEDLVVGSNLDGAARSVRAFYGNNNNYIEEEAKNLSPPEAPLLAMSVSSLMTTRSSEAFDRRNNTIEIQVEGDVGCHGGLLEHVVLPKDFKKLDHVIDRIENDWGVSMSFYRTSRIDPGRLAELAAQEAINYVEANYV